MARGAIGRWTHTTRGAMDTQIDELQRRSVGVAQLWSGRSPQHPLLLPWPSGGLSPQHPDSDPCRALTRRSQLFCPLDDFGCFTATAPLPPALHGHPVRDCNDWVLASLQARSLLLHCAAMPHDYPHCWRCDTPLLFRATLQYFVSLEACPLLALITVALFPVLKLFESRRPLAYRSAPRTQ